MLSHVVRNEEQWNAFVADNGGGFLQSWEWASFQEALGRSVYRFRLDVPMGSEGEGRHEDTVAQFLMVYQDLPLGMRYAYLPMGPVVRRGPDQREFFGTCIGAVRDAIAREGAVFARLEPPYPVDDSPVDGGDLRQWGLHTSRPVQPKDTAIVGLGRSEDAILAAMHHKTRYNIRLAERRGVVVREAEYANAHLYRHDADLFWMLLGETAARDSFHTHEKRYYDTMLDVLSQRKGGGLKLRLYFAEHDGDALAAAIVAEFAGTATYLHGASTNRKRNLMAPYLLHWRIMQEAKARGFGRYDLWGIAPSDDPSHPWAGITRFKRGFGGERVSYHGAWELPRERFWYTLYRAAKRIAHP